MVNSYSRWWWCQSIGSLLPQNYHLVTSCHPAVHWYRLAQQNVWPVCIIQISLSQHNMIARDPSGVWDMCYHFVIKQMHKVSLDHLIIHNHLILPYVYTWLLDSLVIHVQQCTNLTTSTSSYSCKMSILLQSWLCNDRHVYCIIEKLFTLINIMCQIFHV